MLDRIEAGICRALDRDDAWLGIRRLRPDRDRPYTSSTLLKVGLAYGVVAGGLLYGLTWLLLAAFPARNSLRDDATWLPRLVAWVAVVAFLLTQCASMWAWNRRARRLDPGAFRRGRAGRLG